MVPCIAFLHRENEKKIRRIVSRLFRSGKISFEGKTGIDFSGELNALETAMGKKHAKSFASLSRKELEEEVGWARHYIISFIDPTIVLNRW